MEAVLWMWCQRRPSLLRMRKTSRHLLKRPPEWCHTTPDSSVGGSEQSSWLPTDIRASNEHSRSLKLYKMISDFYLTKVFV